MNEGAHEKTSEFHKHELFGSPLCLGIALLRSNAVLNTMTENEAFCKPIVGRISRGITCREGKFTPGLDVYWNKDKVPSFS